MSAGEDYTSLVFRLAALDFPPIPLEEGKAVRGAALAGWRQRLEPDLEGIAAQSRMHLGHSGGYLKAFWPTGLITGLCSADQAGAGKAGTPLPRMSVTECEAARHGATKAAAHRQQAWWPDALVHRATVVRR